MSDRSNYSRWQKGPDEAEWIAYVTRRLPPTGARVGSARDQPGSAREPAREPARALAQVFGLTEKEIRGVPPPHDPYTTHRRKLEILAVELPLAPERPRAKYVPLDEDFWIPDAEPEGIVPRPGGRR